MSDKKTTSEEQINKFLKLSIASFKEQYKDSETDFIPVADELPPTGILLDNPLMEFLLCRRFLSYGRCYLLYGKKADGKTAFFYDLAKLFIRNGGVVIWLETENAADKDFAAAQGVDISKVRISHPKTLEEALTAVKCFIENMPKAFPDSDVPVLLCLDSIAGSQTEWEADQEIIGTSKPGSHAKILSEFYRQIFDNLAHEKCVFLAINQLKQKIGGFAGFGDEPEAMIGGEATRFSNTYQLKFARTGDITAPDPDHPGIKRKIGSSHKIVVKRNKLGIEGNSHFIEVDNMGKGGYTWYESLVDHLCKYYKELAYKSGAFCRWAVPGMTFINPNTGVAEPIDTEKNYPRRDMALILANSEEAKERIRTAFKIPPLPAIEEVVKVETENKKKRAKKKNEPKSTL